jgi:hypothetical protein
VLAATLPGAAVTAERDDDTPLPPRRQGQSDTPRSERTPECRGFSGSGVLSFTMAALRLQVLCFTIRD